MTHPIPRNIRAGTSLMYRRSARRFPALDGWTYTLALSIPGYTPVEATVDGGDFVFVIPASATASWLPGSYAFSERVSRGGEVHEIGSGMLTVSANLASATAGDGLTHNQRTLNMIEAAIEGRVVDGIENYSIAGRAVSKIPLPELSKLRDKYRMQVILERNGGRLGTMHVAFTGGYVR